MAVSRPEPEAAGWPAGQARLPPSPDRRPRRPGRRGLECTGPGPQHPGVARLDQLRRDVHHDIRPGLEVRADDADRAAPFVKLKPVRQVSDRPAGRLGRDACKRPKLIAIASIRLSSSASRSTNASASPSGACGAHVVGVRGQHACGPFPNLAAMASSAASRRSSAASLRAAAPWRAACPASMTTRSASVGVAAVASLSMLSLSPDEISQRGARRVGSSAGLRAGSRNHSLSRRPGRRSG